MRASFNTTFDVYYGLHSPFGVPNLQYAANLPCRYVPQTEIVQQDFPLTLTNAWMTNAALLMNGPDYKSLALGQWNADIWTADQVAIPSGTAPAWAVLRQEDMNGPAQSPYWRCALLPLARVVYPDWLPPSPPPGPTPGMTCLTAGPLAVGTTGPWPVPAGNSSWWSFMSLFGSHYTVTIAGTAQPGTTTRVWVGGCIGLILYQGPMVGNGALPWFEFLGQQVWVEVNCPLADSYTITLSSP